MRKNEVAVVEKKENKGLSKVKKAVATACLGLFTDGFKELKKASEPLYKTPKSIQETIVSGITTAFPPKNRT